MAVLLPFFSCQNFNADESSANILFESDFKPVMDLPHSGGQKTVYFTAKEDWNVVVMNTKSTSWCSVDPISGEAGDSRFTVSVQANNTDSSRSAEIRIISGDDEESIRVEQPGLADESEALDFDDEVFKSALQDILGLKGDIYPDDIAELHRLDLNQYGIRTMIDIRHFPSLDSLECNGNLMSDLILSYGNLSTLKFVEAGQNDSLERVWVFNDLDTLNDVSISVPDFSIYAVLASDNHFKTPLRGGEFELRLRPGIRDIKSEKEYSWIHCEKISELDQNNLSVWNLRVDETDQPSFAELYVESETDTEGKVTELIRIFTDESFRKPYSTTVLAEEIGRIKVAERKDHEEFEKPYSLVVEYYPTKAHKGQKIDVRIDAWLETDGSDEKTLPDSFFVDGVEKPVGQPVIFGDVLLSNDLEYEVTVAKNGIYYDQIIVVDAFEKSNPDYELQVTPSPATVEKGANVDVRLKVELIDKNSKNTVTPDEVSINGKDYPVRSDYVFAEGPVQSDIVYQVDVVKSGQLYQKQVVISMTTAPESDNEYELWVEYAPEKVYIGKKATVILLVSLKDKADATEVVPDKISINGSEMDLSGKYVFETAKVKEDLTYEIVVQYGDETYTKAIVVPAQNTTGGEEKYYRMEVQCSPEEVKRGTDALICIDLEMYEVSQNMKVKPDVVYINGDKKGNYGNYTIYEFNVQSDLHYYIMAQKDAQTFTAEVTVRVVEPDYSLQFYGPQEQILYYDPLINKTALRVGVLNEGKDFSWRLSTDADWLYFDTETGEGVQEVEMIVNGTDQSHQRQCQFTLEALDPNGTVQDSYSWTVCQQGVYIEVLDEGNLAQFNDIVNVDFEMPVFFHTPYPSAVTFDVRTNGAGLNALIYEYDQENYDPEVKPKIQATGYEQSGDDVIFNIELSYPSNRNLEGDFPGKFRAADILLLPTNRIIDNWSTMEYSSHNIIDSSSDYLYTQIKTYQLPIIMTGLDYWYVAPPYSGSAGSYPNKVRGYDEYYNPTSNSVSIASNVSGKFIYDGFDEVGIVGWNTSSPSEITADGRSYTYADLDISFADRKRRDKAYDEFLGQEIYRSYSTYSYKRVADLGAVLCAEVDMKDGLAPLLVPVTEIYQLGIPLLKADISWLRNEELGGLNFNVCMSAEFELIYDALTFYMNFDHLEFAQFAGYNDNIGAPGWSVVSEEGCEFQCKVKASETAIFMDTFRFENDARIVFRDGSHLYCSEHLTNTYVVDVTGARQSSQTNRKHNYVDALPELTSPADVLDKKTVRRGNVSGTLRNGFVGRTVRSSDLYKIQPVSGI